MGPPYFTETLPSLLTVEANKVLTYTLPSIADDDGDKYSITVDRGEALMFCQFKDGKFTFEPKLANVKESFYVIKIVLSDDNLENRMSQEYRLRV